MMRFLIFAVSILLCSRLLAQKYEFDGFTVDLPDGVQVREQKTGSTEHKDNLHEFFYSGHKILFIHTSYHPILMPSAPSLDYENLAYGSGKNYGVRWQCGQDLSCFAVKFTFSRRDTWPYMSAGYEGNNTEDTKLADQIIRSLAAPEVPIVERYMTQKGLNYNIFNEYCISIPKDYFITKTSTSTQSQYTFSKKTESGYPSPFELVISDTLNVEFTPTESSYYWIRDFGLSDLYKNFRKNNISILIQKHSDDLIFFKIELSDPRIFLKFTSHYSKNKPASVFSIINTLIKRKEGNC